jgi:hypothetical protein
MLWISIKPLLQFKFDYILYIIGILSFIVGIFLSSKPVFVHPMKRIKIRGDDEHDCIIHFAFYIGYFCISLPFFNPFYTLASESYQNNKNAYPNQGLFDLFGLGRIYFFVFSCLIFLYFNLIIYQGLRVILGGILRKINKRKSLRPIYCEKCKKELKLIKSAVDFLNEKEITAMRIKSIYFEAWYCQSCCRKIERHSIHLRAYVSLSDEFKFCQDCKEATMTKTSRIIKEATTTTAGKILIIYTCNCCYKKEEELLFIDDSGAP